MGESLALAPPPSEYFRNTGQRLGAAQLAARISLAGIYDSAMAYEAHRVPKHIVAATINEVATVPGVEILEPTTNFAADKGYRCVEYAFGVVLGEPWAQGGFTCDITPELWNDPARFLGLHGYRPVLDPTAGDVVFYGGFNEGRDKVWLGHVGVFAGTNTTGVMQVISKFGKGPVVRHDIHLIPLHRFDSWGEEYWFLRKHSPVPPIQPADMQPAI